MMGAVVTTCGLSSSSQYVWFGHEVSPQTSRVIAEMFRGEMIEEL